ncbi:hypothetical protein B0H94_11861 [Salsuginibacillus halophilus]|uniref:Helix-turn-helix protein n=1 Tax=Salsuginibacillus halophilus TaxID=517424 RepID=A0A2P8H6B0_9BACI|nr:helix-turn-helix domain-containing protein [Salsuginibacillus halophilus]PSL41748.1 hypothetical protein B0H94_11861 [Salsuginibacillus halophilus]
MQATELPLVLSKKDVEEILGVGDYAGRNLFADPSFPSFKVGGKHKVYRVDFMQWLEGQKQTV